MIGYLYLSGALAAGLAKGFCGKKISGAMHSFKDCVFINAARMLFCVAIGFLFVLFEWNFSSLRLDWKSLGVYLLSAAGMTAFCVCWMYAYKQDAYVFLNIFTMLGSVITCFLSFLVYKESIAWNEWLGMAILLCAVVIMSKYNKEMKGKITPLGLAILTIGCLGSAVTDFSQKAYMRSVGESAAAFNFYTYLIGFLILAVLQLATNAKKDGVVLSTAVKDKRHILAYFFMSLFLFLNTALKTLAAGVLGSAQIYPVLQGANLILSGLMAHFLFKERASVKSIVAMALAFCGLLIMNLL
ncbi:MAG: EamA family transporter [Clostridia bacterium]|nr:EamA family transporter [Clostridia bacterium]